MLAIIFLAALFRLLSLNQLPPGLFLDEALYGLDAYSLLKTGKDIYGHFLPLAFQSSGYYPPLFTYVLAPFFLILPLSAWTVRFPAALSGIAAVLLTYLLVKELFSSSAGKIIALLAAALLAFSPLHLHFSRVAFLSSFGLVFPLLATYLFLRHHYIFSSVVFALSTHAHYGYKLFSPLLFIILVYLHRRQIKFQFNRLVISISLIALIAFLTNWYAISHFNALSRVNQLSGSSLTTMITSYFKAYLPQFLFLNSDSHLITNPWGKGLLPLSLLPLLVVGIINLKSLPPTSLVILLAWLFIPPIPSALAGAGAHALRIIPIIIPLIIISALGLEFIIRQAKTNLITKVTLAAIIAFLVIDHLSYLDFYTHKFPVLSAYLWGNPERHLISQALATTTPTIIPDTFNVYFSYYAFMTKLDPIIIQQVINQPVKSFNQVQFVDALRL